MIVYFHPQQHIPCYVNGSSVLGKNVEHAREVQPGVFLANWKDEFGHQASGILKPLLSKTSSWKPQSHSPDRLHLHRSGCHMGTGEGRKTFARAC